ncbi:Putrescine-binding periplasmic protein SpuD [compost metagenome]
MLRPEVIAQTTNFQRNPNANRDATALVDQAIRDNPMVYPPKQVLETLFPLEPLPLPLERQRTRIWNQLKVGLFP